MMCDVIFLVRLQEKFEINHGSERIKHEEMESPTSFSCDINPAKLSKF